MKKGLVAFVILILTGVPAFSQVALLEGYYAESEAVFPLAKTANFTKVPFELVKGMILVKAEIEGRRGNFILDTGAPSLIVNGENIDGDSENWVNVSGDFNAQTILVNQFSWAGIQKNGIEAIALDISHLEECYQRELLGVIGYQIFSDREILIDAKRMQIIIFNGKENDLSRIGQPLATLSFTIQGHLPVIKTKIGDSFYNFGFDSGCTANLIDEQVLTRLPEEAYQIVGQRELQGFSQEAQSVLSIHTQSVRVEGLPEVGMNFLAADFSHLKGTGIQIDGLLGYPFFKNLTFSINYSKRKLSIWKIHSQTEVLMP